MEFDVFLCHNSQDKPEIRDMALQLQKRGLKPWLDEWELPPGQLWQELLEEQIEQIKSAAVFVGESGFGPWQKREMRAFLSEFVDRGCPVIPVLLRNAPQKPQLPIFLKALTWVDFRQAETKPMERLIWGITRTKPDDFDSIQFFDESPSKDTAKEREAAATSKASDRENKQEQRKVQSTSVDLGNGIILEMVTIPGGTFLMGSTDGHDSEKPQHRVIIQPFALCKYPITQEQWEAVMGESPSRFKGANLPVERVSWADAIEFCGRLSRLTDQNYRLPSEAEWEYACRAGTTSDYSFGETINIDVANFNKKIGETTPVGKYPANRFGLYDMHGNVWEWCEDDWHPNYENAPTDGRAWLVENGSNISNKVLRGGSWNENSLICRSSSRIGNWRDDSNDLIGFRVVYDGFERA